MDYREIAGETFDAIASIGMVEHVGSVNIDEYAAKLASLLRPGGRLLNHGIARLRVGEAEAGPFSERYVFPDAAPLHLSRIQLALERAGLHTRHVEDFPDDYARTLLGVAEALRDQHRPGARARRRRARAGLADLPARLAPGLRERLHLGLSGARGQGDSLALALRLSSRLRTSAIRKSTISGSGIGLPVAWRRRISPHRRM